MKKYLLTMLMLAGLCGIRAQEYSAAPENTFYLSATVGANSYAHSGTSSFGMPTFGIEAGAWVLRPLAIQLSFNGVNATSAIKEVSAFYMLGDVELKWDVNATFFHVYNKRFLNPIPVYPLLGMGVAYRGDLTVDGEAIADDRSLHAMMGFQLPIRIAPRWDVMAEYKCFFLRQGFEKSQNNNIMHLFNVGVTHRWYEGPFNRRGKYDSRSVANDWFLGFGIGANYSAFDIFSNPNSGGLSMIGIAPEIMFGRNLSDIFTMRFEFTGLSAHEAYDTITEAPSADYTFTMLHVDLMGNASHLSGFSRGVKWNFLPYIGAGLIWRYDDVQFDIAADAGLMIRRYINREGDLFLDLKYVMIPPHVGGGRGPSGNDIGVGLPSITVGYIHNFGQSSTRYRMPYDYAE